MSQDKLIKAAAEAKAAGLSYGQWMARQPKAKKKDQVPYGWKICEYCGEPFELGSKGTQQKYCDSVCCKKAQNARAKQRGRNRFQSERRREEREERDKNRIEEAAAQLSRPTG